MSRKYIDCREFPSEMNCSVARGGASDAALLEAAVPPPPPEHPHPPPPHYRIFCWTPKTVSVPAGRVPVPAGTGTLLYAIDA